MNIPNCPKCGGAMYDNRFNKKNPKGADFTCKDKMCLNDKGYRTGVWLTAAQKSAMGGTQQQGAPQGGDDRQRDIMWGQSWNLSLDLWKAYEPKRKPTTDELHTLATKIFKQMSNQPWKTGDAPTPERAYTPEEPPPPTEEPPMKDPSDELPF